MPTTITETIDLPTGASPDGATVTITLIGSKGHAVEGFVTGTSTIVGEHLPTVTNGAWSAALVPNASITPSGTAYKRVIKPRRGKEFADLFEVPSSGGPYTLYECLTETPGSIATSTYSALASRVTELEDTGASEDDLDAAITALETEISGSYAQVVAGLLSIGGVALLESAFPATLARDTEVTTAVGVETSRATAAEALLAPLASPALTGNPTAPTQTAGNSSTRLATTAFVNAEILADAYTPGGSDVAVADGGTGASTAPAALTSLGAAAIDLPTWAYSSSSHRSHRSVAGRYNWRPENTRNLEAAIARALAGGANADVVLIGDSIVEGYGVTHEQTFGMLLPALFGLPTAGSGFRPSVNNGADDGWSYGSGWVFGSSTFMSGSTTSGLATLAPLQTGANVDLWIYGSSAAQGVVRVDGALQANIVPNTANAPQRYSLTGFANTVHTVTVTGNVAIPLYLVGGMVWNPTGGMHVHNVGISTTTAQVWADSGSFINPTPAYAAIFDSGTVDRDAVFIGLGVNDAATGRTVAQMKADLATVITAWRKSSCDVVLVAHNNATVSEATWLPYLAAYYELADTYDIPLIDMHAAIGNLATATTAGLIGADNVHIGPAGHRAYAAAITGEDPINAYTPGGTDVPVADGGTGASTGPLALVNLGAEPALSRLAPTAAIAETFPRRGATIGNGSPLTSGRHHLVAVPLAAGQVVTSITFVSGTQALVTGSNQWFGLWSSARAKLGVTSDDTSTAWAANTAKTLNLASPYTVPTTGMYYVSICVVASTVPSLQVVAGSSAVNGLAPITSGTSDTGLTNPASAPSTAAALTAAASVPYAYVS